MKILVYGLSNNIGGVETIVLSIISRLLDRCSFDILISGQCAYKQFYQGPKIRFLDITSWGSNPSIFSKELADILNSENYEYVWINGCIMANKTIISTIKKNSNCKIITHSHGTSFEETNFFKSLILKSLHYINRNYYLKNIDIPCSCSLKSAKWYYGAKYSSKKKIYIVNNGVDIDKFSFNSDVRDKLRQEYGVGDAFLLFHAGRLTAVKNQKKILDITKELLKRGINVKLWIAGEGELESDLRSYADFLGVSSHVSFLGFRKDIYSLCQAADAFILPSFHEGLPVTVIEAQASGLSCFLSDTITKEADVSGLVHFISLDCSSMDWASEILNQPVIKNRLSAVDLIKEHRYDIQSIADDFYHLINQNNESYS